MAKVGNTVSVKISVPDFSAKVEKLSAKLHKALDSANKKIAKESKAIIKEELVGVGVSEPSRLLSSVTATVLSNSNSKKYTSTMFFKEPGNREAFFLNYGSKGHGKYPPENVIIDWAKRKGILLDAWVIQAIRKHIAINGTQAREFWSGASKRIQDNARLVANDTISEFKRMYK